MPVRRAVHLIDGSGQVHRAYFAIRGLSTRRGLPTNATYGFTVMLRKLFEDEAPVLAAIALDLPGPTFRHQQYAEYKAHRPKMDEDLAVQLPYVRRVCEAFRLPIVEATTFEADDVIATITRQALAADLDVVIVSSDKDLLQLVTERVHVLVPGREGGDSVRYDPAAVEAKWGVPPERIVDVLALAGDSSDNVPGVPGIGEKGAKDLIREFGSLEAALDGAERVKRAAYREGLKNHRESALLSRRLVVLRDDAPVTLDLSLFERREPDRAAAHTLFAELEFAGLAKEFAPETSTLECEVAALSTGPEVERVIAAARASGSCALAVALAEREGRPAEMLGLALASDERQAGYVPASAAGFAALAPLLEDATLPKLCFSFKRDRRELGRLGTALRGATFDLTLAAYLLEPGRRRYDVEALALEYLGAQPEAAVAGSPSRSAGLQAHMALRLAARFRERLDAEGLTPIYRDLELPLAEVLAEMEQTGVAIDTALLRRMGEEMEGQLAGLTRSIHDLAGGEFNINSPVQLREVLFGKLGLKSGKKTAKTRAASTAEEVLDELAAEHELPRRIIEYRAVQKLKSTYVDALPQLVRPETGRVHATFHQTVAATGRLSSSDPNLQNIPIRTPEGRRIREAFVAPPGHKLLSADYSQIELRVLAHLSGDPVLIETFRRGEDVHDRTAREVFGPFSPIPRDQQRSFSKMINYALLYGKTAFTLAKDLGVGRKEAETFIAAYFDRYPQVRGFIERTLAEARQTGVVRTLLGRLRRLPDLGAKNTSVRLEAERQAINTPVQGSAADLIKKAMIDLTRALAQRKQRARLVLQIHDELLLEVPDDEAEETLALVRKVMQGALALDVPLVVDARLGRNWAEAH